MTSAAGLKRRYRLLRAPSSSWQSRCSLTATVTTMFAYLSQVLLLLLLSFLAALVHGAASPRTYMDTDPVSGAPVLCDRCAPGSYLRARCTATRKTECAPCPQGSFTALWNYIEKCLRCGVCGQNQVVKTACKANSNCQCECRAGFFYRKDYDMCLPHNQCHSGQEAQTPGTPDRDTVCRACPNGTFSDSISAHRNCTLHRSCSGPGQQLVLKGFLWHDSVCTTCQELQGKDGGDYLKEILPAFFVHQNMQAKRLRRILHKLPSPDGKRQGISKLGLSDLHANIKSWVASATAAQIRKLPDILADVGSVGAGERLQHKLQRIDSNLKGLCGSENEISDASNSVL